MDAQIEFMIETVANRIKGWSFEPGTTPEEMAEAAREELDGEMCGELVNAEGEYDITEAEWDEALAKISDEIEAWAAEQEEDEAA